MWSTEHKESGLQYCKPDSLFLLTYTYIHFLAVGKGVGQHLRGILLSSFFQTSDGLVCSNKIELSE